MSHSHLAGPTLRFRGDPELHWGLGRVLGQETLIPWVGPGRFLLEGPPPHLTSGGGNQTAPADAFVRWKARRVTVRAFQPNRRELPVV